MGIFSDMEMGKVVLVVAVLVLMVVFGGKNVFRDDSGSGSNKGSGSSNNNSNNSNSGTQV